MPHPELPARVPARPRPARVAVPSTIFALVIALGVAVGALDAGDGAREKALTPKSIEKFSGPEVAKAVEKVLAGVHWHTDLSHALAVAAEEGKPVFWLQLVGGLDDGL